MGLRKGRKRRKNPNRRNEYLGKTVVIGWIDGGGRVLVEDFGNEAGEVACWLNGTPGRLAVEHFAHGMIQTAYRI